MKLRNFTFAAFAAAALASSAAYVPVGQSVSAVNIERPAANPEIVTVNYVINGKTLRVPSNSELKVTPVLFFAGDSIEMQPVVFAGHNAYIAHKRNDDVAPGVTLLKASSDVLERNEIIAWQPAMMPKAELAFRTELIGCRCKSDGRGELPDRFAALFGPETFDIIIPRRQLAELELKVDEIVKTREVSKSAYVNYKVNSTVLLPDFMDNKLELAKIVATIDSVCCDKDLTVESVNIHGFASPEGSYANNSRLAAGRTDALRAYVDKRFGFGKTLTSGSTPEDWAGLRRWVASSSINNKQGILKIIDSSMKPDAKDQAIRTQYPTEYAMLLKDVYPTLRRADYKIEYVVRTFTDPADIAVLLVENPDKLSMEEIMLLARTYPEGSVERENLIVRSAELIPTDERAQLNAAFIHLSRGEYDKASQKLKKSGDSPLADYGRGLLALNSQDYTTARPLLERADAAGIEGAKEALAFLSTRE